MRIVIKSFYRVPYFLFLALFVFCGDLVKSQTLSPAGPLSICPGDSVIIKVVGAGANTNFQWIRNGNNINGATLDSIVVKTAGSYECNLMPGPTIGPVVVTLNSAPNADFNGASNPKCVGIPFNFTDNSSGTITSYFWSFGDGGTATTQDASHSYSAPGTYPVKLVVTNSLGCKDSITKNVTVRPLPVADFSFTPNGGCGKTKVTFTNLSTTPAGSAPMTYSWDFGDGGNSNSTNPTHTFRPSPGTGNQTFTITLTVTNTYGCVSTKQSTITIGRGPDAALDATDANGNIVSTTINGDPAFKICSATGSLFNFYNTSATIASNTNYVINWGDGSSNYTNTTFPAANPVQHSYPVGLYTMTFYVYSGSCVDSAQYTVFVGNTPAGGLASPGGTTICSGSSQAFLITNATANPPGTMYVVTFNDGSVPDTLYHPPPDTVRHIFLNSSCGNNTSTGIQTFPNSYGAFLSISNPCGTTGGSIVPIYVSGKPQANFSITPKDTICTTQTITFTNTGNFGNNVENGVCTAGKLVWSISPDLPGTPYTLTAGTLGSISPFGAYTSGTNAITVKFDSAGVYQIKLKMKNSTLCGVDSIVKTVCVNKPPVADFTIDNNVGCSPVTVNTTNLTSTPNCGVYRYVWGVTYAAPPTACDPPGSSYSLLNGTTLTSTAPQFQFDNPGTYTISLQAFAPANACSSAVVTKTVEVKGKPKVALTAPSSMCVGNTISPSATATCYIDAASTYAWSFPGGSPATATTLNPGTITYSTPGTYAITLTVTNICGSTTVTQNIVVNPLNTAGAPSANPILCIGTPLTPITITTTGATGIGSVTGLPTGVTATWAGNTITISGTPTQSGTFNYSIPLSGGCGAIYATGTITVTPNNTAGAPSASPNICINTPLTPITISTTGATGIGTVLNLPAGVSATWSGNVITISGTPTVAGTFNYSITLTGGCGTVTATGTIIVRGNNTVGAPSANPTLCINTPLSPSITFSTGGATGIGTPSGLPTGLNATWLNNTITISGTPTQSGTFSYSIPLSGGCGAANAMGTITVNPANSVTAAQSTTVCINTPISPSLTYTTTGASGIGPVTGLPAGVTATWNSGTITVSGTPTVAGNFNFSIPLTGGCGSVTATGTIIVTPNNTAAVTLPLTTCVNVALSPNITITTTGATGIGVPTGLPAGVSASWTGNVITISGTPTATGTFTYSIPLTGGCGTVNATGTIIVVATNTAGTPSANPTLCIGTALSPVITISTAGATGIGTPSGLPTGVTASWLNNTITISGTPTQSGTFTYTIPLTGGCGTVNATGTITVNPNNTVTAPQNVTLCINTAISPNLTFTATGATGIGTPSNLPSGVTASWSGGTITVSGTPTQSGTFNYSIPLTGGCGAANATGTITVTPDNTFIPPSPRSTCVNIALTPNITIATTGATGIGTVIGLPPGLSASWAGNLITISGTPTSTGVYSYSIPLTGGCGNINATGSITVVATNTAGAPSANPSLCVNTLLTPISIATTGATGIGTITGLPAGVSANWASNTITISGTPTTVGVFNYSILLTGGCGSATASGTITVITNNTVTAASSNPSLCVNSLLSPDITFTTTGATGIGTPTGLPAGLSATWLNNTITISGTPTAAGTFTYSIPLTGGCGTVNATGTITVKPRPSVQSETTTICGGQSFSVTPLNGGGNSIPVGTTYSWPAPVTTGGMIGTSGSGVPITGTLNNSTTDPQTATYTITPSAAGCTGPDFTLVVTVNPAPTLSFSIPDQTVCSGAATQAVAISSATLGANINWVMNANGATAVPNTLSGTTSIPSYVFTNSTSAPISVTFTATISTGGALACPGVGGTYTITVNPSPAVTFSLPKQTICSGDNSLPVTIGSPTAGVTITWSANTTTTVTGYTPSGGNTIPVQTLLNAGPLPDSVAYVVQATTGGSATCPGGASTYYIVVNPNPDVAATPSSQTICSGTQTGIALTSSIPNTTFAWTISTNANITGASAGNGNSINQTLTNSSTSPQNITYTITPTLTHNGKSCPGAPITVTITVDPRPRLSGTKQFAVCSGDLFSYIANSQTSGVTYSWTRPAVANITPITSSGSDGTINETLFNFTSAPIQVNYVFTLNFNGCTQLDTVRLTVNPRPQIRDTLITICSGSNFSFTPVDGVGGNVVPAGTKYSWAAPTYAFGNISNGQLGSNLTSVSGTLSNASVNPDTAYYLVTPVSGAPASCSGQPFMVKVVVNPAPTLSFSIPNQTVCSGASTAPVTINTLTNNATINWTLNAGGLTFTPNQTTGTTNIPSYIFTNSGSAPVTVTFVATISTGGALSCPGVGGTYSIIVNPAPATTLTPGTQVICSGSQTQSIALSSATAGVSYNWVSTVSNPTIGGNTVSGNANPIPVQTLTNTGIDTGYVLYTVTASTGGNAVCPGSPAYDTVIVNPIPDVVATPSIDTICSGTATSIQLTSRVNRTVFRWTVPAPLPAGLTGASNGTGSLIAQVLINSTPSPITINYTITPEFTFRGKTCYGTPIVVPITVDPRAKISGVKQFTVCTGNPFSYTATSLTSGVTYSWNRPAVANITPTTNAGTNGTINETLVNPTQSPILVKYYFTLNYNGCTNPDSILLTVNPNAKSTMTVDTTIGCPPFDIRQHITVVRYPNANDDTQYKWLIDTTGSYQQLGALGITVPNYSITQPGKIVKICLVAVSKWGCQPDTSCVTFKTVELPVPSFTKDKDTACGPAVYTFTNTTTPIATLGTTNYLWNFGNGQTSTAVQPPPVTYVANVAQHIDTTYFITLDVTTACQTIRFRDSIHVRPGPKALFQPDTTVGCSPFNLCFRNNSLGMPNVYTWDFGDGSPRLTYNDNRRVCHRYTTGVLDTFTVTLYAQNECNIDSFKVDIIVYPATITPKLIVFGQNTFGCAPRPVTFINNSVGGTLYEINFGDGSPLFQTSNSIDTFTHVFLNAGTYNVCMRSTNSCTDTTVCQVIDIYQAPTANFTFNKPDYCFGDPVVFTNTSTPNIQYDWYFGDGTQALNTVSPTHLYQAPGSYTVTLIATSSFAAGASCTDTIRKVVLIRPRPVAAFTSNANAQNCAPFNYTATATGSGFTTINWFYYNASNVQIYSNSGNSSNYTFTTPGTYSIVMVAYAGSGCTDTARGTVVVIPSPVVRFTPGDTAVCGPCRTVTFTNQSTYAGTDVVDYQWLINGSVVSTNSGQMTYQFCMPTTQTTPSTYTITLNAISSVGRCTGTMSHTLTLLPKPLPRFKVTPDSACAPMTVTFRDSTLYADNFAWYVSAGGGPYTLFSTQQVPASFVLTQAATTYQFMLVASNNQGGCGPETSYYSVRTLPTPKALFTINGSLRDTLYNCKQLTASINNSSYMNTPGNSVGLISAWYLNGVRQNISVTNPVFQLLNTSYTRDTLIEIKLIVASSAGCLDTTRKWVYLYPEPLASFSLVGNLADCAAPSSRLVKNVVNQSMSKQPATYQWSVYNLTTASNFTGITIVNPNAATPSFIMPDNVNGTDTAYEFRLRVTSPDGCFKDTMSRYTLYARPLGKFRLSDTTSCSGQLSVTFTDLSLSGASPVVVQYWNFDDGSTLNNQTIVTHQYTSYGIYNPFLVVKNARGCLSDTIRKRIVVFGAPRADFTALSRVCMGTAMTFTNLSQPGFGSTNLTQTLWDFGDGNTSTQLSPNHTYASAGTYTVTLTVRSDSSCVPASKTQQVTVVGKPTANFSFANNCINRPVQFTNLSTSGLGDANIGAVTWTFGDGGVSTSVNPQHTYTSLGTYTVTMTVAGASCGQLTDVMTKTITIRQARADSIYPLIYTSYNVLTPLAALPGGVSYLWTPSIGLQTPGLQFTNALYAYTAPSKINYNINIVDSNGCVINDKQEVWLFEKPDVFAPTAFTPNGDQINDVFIPFYINIKSLGSFRIFDRWGKKIFETNDLLKSWDGKINGIDAPLETYAWVVECYDAFGNKLMRKGMVTLVRY